MFETNEHVNILMAFHTKKMYLFSPYFDFVLITTPTKLIYPVTRANEDYIHWSSLPSSRMPLIGQSSCFIGQHGVSFFIYKHSKIPVDLFLQWPVQQKASNNSSLDTYKHTCKSYVITDTHSNPWNIGTTLLFFFYLTWVNYVYHKPQQSTITYESFTQTLDHANNFHIC